jgi:transcriptional regulator with XRE-family HTH domain
MSASAEKTGLSRETLYRTLSGKGNPHLDTLAAVLAAFGLRLSVRPARKSRARPTVAEIRARLARRPAVITRMTSAQALRRER